MAPRPNVSSTKSERLAREKRRIKSELSGLNLARREIEKFVASEKITPLKNGRHRVCIDQPEPSVCDEQT